jgi:hypothetical protein
MAVQHVVTAVDDGCRARAFVRAASGWSVKATKRAFKAGMVVLLVPAPSSTVDKAGVDGCTGGATAPIVGDVLEDSRRLWAGDRICLLCHRPQGRPNEAASEDSGAILGAGTAAAATTVATHAARPVPPPSAAALATIDVCHEDDHLAVLWKPFGLSAAAGARRSELSLSAALTHLLRPSSAESGKPSDGAVGVGAGTGRGGSTWPRLMLGPLLLEKWTAGMMIAAKSSQGWAHVMQLLQGGGGGNDDGGGSAAVLRLRFVVLVCVCYPTI